MTPRVELVELDPATLRALATADAVSAARTAPVPLSPWLVGAECRGLWRMRAAQVAADPAASTWVTRVVWDPDRRLAVGRAGFHGPPDDAGMVEVGYATDPSFQRQGYARAALRALLDRAAVEPAVTTVRASVSPGNVVSRDLVLAHGFVEVGQQEDEEDGHEIVYERPVGASPVARA
ncbi:N-acetyltransferase [Blastococcus sp. CT_GayMR20]|uniref:GNAT family N-acetyltransferase n=1 Tax=Blastococcus sp. CT_GayMR20 TaxID=2559609 RepID=UPI001074020A|nr:GNAT family protein [Blastococcus sp. CT_GayMR20]TFV91029.1 N-acetyltransferase [Blastococcus sp. CT_GayMR20]